MTTTNHNTFDLTDPNNPPEIDKSAQYDSVTIIEDVPAIKLTPEEAQFVRGDIPRVPLVYAKKLAEAMEFYKNLLRKYIEHVGSIEGHTYIGDNMGTVDFTQQELDELKRLSEEGL